MPDLNSLTELLKSLVGDGIGRAVYDMLPHEETGKGLRPQDDASVKLLRDALRAGGHSEKVVQAALRAPGTTAVSTGDPSLLSLTGLRNKVANIGGMGVAGTTSPTRLGSKIGIYPNQAAMMNAQLSTDTVPHELIHALRINKGALSDNTNLEESLARVGANRPLNTWTGRQFEDSPNLFNLYRQPNEPMQAGDLGALQALLQETLSK